MLLFLAGSQGNLSPEWCDIEVPPADRRYDEMQVAGVGVHVDNHTIWRETLGTMTSFSSGNNMDKGAGSFCWTICAKSSQEA